MMVGAVLNMRPDVVGAAVAYVPAADLLTSSFDESLGGTRLHRDDRGSSESLIYRYRRSISLRGRTMRLRIRPCSCVQINDISDALQSGEMGFRTPSITDRSEYPC